MWLFACATVRETHFKLIIFGPFSRKLCTNWQSQGWLILAIQQNLRLNCIFYVIFRIFLWLSIWHNCPKPNSSYTKNYRRSALTNSKTTKSCCLSNSNKIKTHWSLYRTRLPLKLTQFFLDWLTFLYVLCIFLWNRGLKVNKNTSGEVF